MIVREIIKNPNLIENFDWFNDYNDTRSYIIKLDEFELLKKFNNGYSKWLLEHAETVCLIVK